MCCTSSWQNAWVNGMGAAIYVWFMSAGDVSKWWLQVLAEVITNCDG
jgi:hypothetical protein